MRLENGSGTETRTEKGEVQGSEVRRGYEYMGEEGENEKGKERRGGKWRRGAGTKWGRDNKQ